jgi:hypothetical protein
MYARLPFEYSASLPSFLGSISASPLDRMTYEFPNWEFSRKSFAALLLPHLLAVSPLLHYSYKKMGGAPLRVRRLSSFRSCAAIRPRVNPLDSYSSKTCAARPCLSPLESHSCRKGGGYPQMSDHRIPRASSLTEEGSTCRLEMKDAGPQNCIIDCMALPQQGRRD